jgi:serine/threonine-protein kinase
LSTSVTAKGSRTLLSSVALVPDRHHGSTSTGGGLQEAILAAGSSAGAWRIEAVRGAGGAGIVYRARAADGTLVALKVLRAALADEPRASERAMREAELQGRVRHANVLPVLATGTLADHRPYLVTPWVEGESLAERLAGGPLPLAEALPILRGVAAGLDAAHAAGVVHRDLKAANVLLGPGEPPASVRLVDFGVARLVERVTGQTLTGTGAQPGTPEIMAPEQLTGDAVGPAADVYAFGVLAYQALTGRLPFAADELGPLHGQVPAPPSTHAALAEAVDAVILRCLAPRAEERPGSAGEAIEALAAAAAAPAGPRVRADRGEALAIRARAATADALDSVDALAQRLGFQRLHRGADETIHACVDEPAGRAALLAALGALVAAHADLAMVVHLAPVTLLHVGGAVQIVGGALLDLETWPVRLGATGLTISHAARAGTTPA